MPVDYTLNSRRGDSGPRIDYAASLNAEQFAAVTAPPGPILVIAGAGSGKTRTLTYRVAYLVENGVDPENILLLTFTNKAAREMLTRVTNILPDDISRLWGGTFHHVGHKILRRHADELGISRSFSILDREDAKDLMGACLADARIDPKEKGFPKEEVLLEMIGMAANTERSLADVVLRHHEDFTELTGEIEQMARAYAERKISTGGVDYDDLLQMPLVLFRKHPELLEHYQRRFLHVLVDEYQDTNKLQADFVDMLSGGHHQVMVVGDDAQSIYSWRGADFSNIMKFPDRHPGTKIIRIETNYRSRPPILELANASISHNLNQFPKHLRAVKESGARPALVPIEDSGMQARFVAQRALELREQGLELADMAVLYRSHFHSMELQMELTRRNIPFQITSGLRFFEQAHIKDVAAYLKYLVNPNDEVSFRRVALLLPGVGARTAQKMWEAVAGGAPWDKVKVPSKGAPGWQQWIETNRQLEEIKGQGPSGLIELLLDATYKDYLKLKYANASTRIEDVQQLMQFSKQFEDTAEFLAQLSLMTNLEAEAQTSPGGDSDDAIKLSTIHQAKGLEWKVVFVIMLCDGLFPSGRSSVTDEGLEEERRLFYVAVTRAEDELYLTYPRIRMINGSGQMWQKPSRFISELGDSYTEVWNVAPPTPWGRYE
jgi:DNA helicase-2/ATP-dependent DNA helicase PcrA